jgi:DTW domain-containing protein YfiP
MSRKAIRPKHQPRKNCSVCGFSKKTCYCHLIKSFDSKIIFAILIHKLEIERKIATGMLSHLILKNSYLVPGHDYTNDETVNQLIDNSQNHCVVLYPGDNSIDLSRLSNEEKTKIVPSGKQLVVIVIDGTWRTAKQTMRLSKNLAVLPKISFSHGAPSNFRVRKQPSSDFYSTVEAIHNTIELLEDSQGFNTGSREHDNLLEVFDYIVDTQITLKKQRLEAKKLD